MTQLGIMIEGQEGLNWERWRNLCRDVEGLGFASLRRSEHLISLMGDDSRDCIDCWTSLALAAEWTKTIQFGPMVSPMTFHRPAMLARKAAAVDQLSGGRLILGVGAGWNEHEHEMFGVPFLTLKGRMDLFEAGGSCLKPGRSPAPSRCRTRCPS
jgi:alkanesulfonate monooxygenase SsuD/methylene tetrahydromethanopterin reductase-like flavin-dependent oxidoreductase (luciferase family)